MLEAIRTYRDSWILKGLLILVAVSMTFYLAETCYSNRSAVAGDVAAKIGDEVVEGRDFVEEARRLDSYYRSFLGDQYGQLRPSLQIGRSAMQNIIAQKIQLQEARRIGLEATPEEVREWIVESPQFQDASGNFVGSEVYKQAVARQFPGGAGEYEKLVGQDIVLRKWQDMVTASVDVTDAEVEQAFRDRTERVAIDYVVVASADQDVSRDVSDTELRAWYDANQEDYLRDEARRIRYVELSRQARMDQVEITDEDVRAFYDANAERYDRPEQRRARHILFKVDPSATEEERATARRAAESTLENLESGKGVFEDLAKSISQDPVSASKGGDLGFFGRGSMVPPFEEAVFSTPVGDYAPLTETSFGFHVIQVVDERAAGPVPVEDVREEIERQVRARRAQDALRTDADRIRAEITSPDDLDTVAEREGLEVVEKIVTSDDRLPDLAPSPDLRNRIFDMPAGEVTEPLGSARGLVILTLAEVLPPTVLPLEEVRDRVRSTLLNERMRAAAEKRAEQELSRRGSVEAVADALDLDVQESGDLGRGRTTLTGAGGPSDELRDILFADETSEGATGVVRVPAGAVVFEVTRKIEFDRESFEASRDTLREELVAQRRNDLLTGVLNRLQEGYEIEVNDEMVSRYDR